MQYECSTDGGENINLCIWREGEAGATLFNDEGFVQSPRFNADGSGILFELDADFGAETFSDHFVVHGDADSGLATYIVPGFKPTPSPDNSDLVVYLNPINDRFQVGVINLGNIGL